MFDLGGGTFDVSLLDVDDGVFEVKATNGDTHLGGEDFDRKIVDYGRRVQEEAQDRPARPTRRPCGALHRGCERAKIELSSRLETSISLPFITADQTGPKHLR